VRGKKEEGDQDECEQKIYNGRSRRREKKYENQPKIKIGEKSLFHKEII